jgi:hypothetical protein
VRALVVVWRAYIARKPSACCRDGDGPVSIAV